MRLCALGYNVTLLEARERPGGRNWTVRPGDKVTFTDGSTQTCTWDAGHYQNFGPARLPSIHPTILAYCKKLGVELQVEVNMTNSAFLQNDAANSGKPVVMRQAVNDTRGHVSELLGKCINQGALDADMSKTDRDRMLSFLRIYGSLDDAGKYTGSDRAGYSKTAGAGDETGTLSEPIDMHTLLDEDFWQGMLFDQQFDMQATMFQPVGGMDRIPFAFAKPLGPIVQYGSPVTEIRKTAKGVRIGYKQKGAAKSIEADYCINAMPLNILRNTPNDYSAPYKKVFDECTYASRLQGRMGEPPLLGAGLQHLRRPRVRQHRLQPHLVPLGGHVHASAASSSPATPTRPTSPSASCPSPPSSTSPASPSSASTPATATSSKNLSTSVGVASPTTKAPGSAPTVPTRTATPCPAAGRRNSTAAAGAPGVVPVSPQTGQARNPAAARTETNQAYETLLQPDGRIIMAGDHVSHIVAWQEGAALSGLRAVQQLADMTKAAHA